MNIDISSIRNGYNSGEMKPAEIASQVEAMFMEVLIETMENSIEAEGGLYGDSASSDIYRGMIRQGLAAAMSNDMNSPLQQQLGDAIREQSQSVPPVEMSSPRAHAMPVEGRVSSPAGWRRDPITGEVRLHRGTDIAAPQGTPIQAVAEGRVVESGQKGGYGNAVVVETPDGRKMLYAHNLENRVEAGDWVRRGEVIALVGSTGRSTGPHVHFEVTGSDE